MSFRAQPIHPALILTLQVYLFIVCVYIKCGFLGQVSVLFIAVMDSPFVW